MSFQPQQTGHPSPPSPPALRSLCSWLFSRGADGEEDSHASVGLLEEVQKHHRPPQFRAVLPAVLTSSWGGGWTARRPQGPGQCPAVCGTRVSDAPARCGHFWPGGARQKTVEASGGGAQRASVLKPSTPAGASHLSPPLAFSACFPSHLQGLRRGGGKGHPGKGSETQERGWTEQSRALVGGCSSRSSPFSNL